MADGTAAPRTRSGASRYGVVRSDSTKRNKTITVALERLTPHAKYGKYLRRHTVLQVHDPHNAARANDVVEIAPCRPVSKTKSWRLVRVVRRPGGTDAAGGGT